MSRLARASTILLALLLAISIVDWSLTFSARRDPAEPLRAVALGDSMARSQATEVAPIARLFGASAGETGSIKLVGVIAQGARGKGIALMALDGQPAVAVRAGEPVAAGVTLSEVRADRVVLNRSGTAQELSLPAQRVPEGIVKAR